VCAGKPAEWWTDDVQALLLSYVGAVSMVATLTADIKSLPQPVDANARGALLKQRQAETSSLVTLARSLRVSPQSMYRADRADSDHRRAFNPGASQGSKPWDK
jgi:hypothetical protein